MKARVGTMTLCDQALERLFGGDINADTGPSTGLTARQPENDLIGVQETGKHERPACDKSITRNQPMVTQSAQHTSPKRAEEVMPSHRSGQPDPMGATSPRRRATGCHQ